MHSLARVIDRYVAVRNDSDATTRHRRGETISASPASPYTLGETRGNDQPASTLHESGKTAVLLAAAI
jgi:hypothetical protein